MFGGWISYSHPSITETFARMDIDFIAIDMEHSTISSQEAQQNNFIISGFKYTLFTKTRISI